MSKYFVYIQQLCDYSYIVYTVCHNIFIHFVESDNTVDMESASVDAFEIDGVVTICARIFGVTEIERSFIGHIAFVLSSAGKYQQFV